MEGTVYSKCRQTKDIISTNVCCWEACANKWKGMVLADNSCLNQWVFAYFIEQQQMYCNTSISGSHDPNNDTLNVQNAKLSDPRTSITSTSKLKVIYLIRRRLVTKSHFNSCSKL